MEESKSPPGGEGESPGEKRTLPQCGSGLRMFISGCNSLLGYLLIEELRNDHLEDEEDGKAHLFVGTLDRGDDTNPAPSNVKRVVSFNKRTLFAKVLQDCDVLIYNVHAAELEEIRYVVASTFLC